MIRFQGVTYTYPGVARAALHGVDLEITAGEFVLVAGASGVGKSTFLRCINGLVPHFSGGHLSGRIEVDGLDPVSASPKVMSRHVGFVFQDPETQFVLDHVEDDIAFSLENAGMPPQEIQTRITEILDLLELAHLRKRHVATLSGGERQRVAIAAALVHSPNILVLDEPTSQLDPHSAQEVLGSVVRLKQQLDLTVVLSEHRLERVLPFADRIVYFEEHGWGMRNGAPREVLPHMRFSPPVVELGAKLGWKPLPLSIEEAQRFAAVYQDSARRAVQKESVQVKQDSPLLSCLGMTSGYNGKPVLKGVDLELHSGEILALMGANGAGKTTLLRTLVGFQKPDAGRVLLDGRDVTAGDVAQICREVGYLPQDPNSLLFAERVEDELLITLKNHGLENTDGGMDELLERLGLSELRENYPRDMSVGQRQRIALGAIMVTRPKLLLLDEPTRGLDPEAKAELHELLAEWRAEGKAVLLVTHDVELVASAADRVAFMEAGEIILQGDPAQVFSEPRAFMPQITQLFPHSGWLTVDDALQGLKD